MKLVKTAGVSLFALATAWHAWCAPHNVQTVPNGLLIQLGEAQVELAAVNTNTFRLDVAVNGAPEFLTSTFLDDTSNASFSGWREVKRHGMAGIATAAGELLLDPKNGEWTLENANGEILIPRHVLGEFTAGPRNGSVDLNLGWNKHKPMYFYGCGNGENRLEQSNVRTRVGNGVAVIPYYWSKAGYSVLAVTADDNQPAFWHAGINSDSVTWVFPGTRASLYLMPSATLKDAAKNYAQLTGHAPVPPRWTFGYLQSRWGWANQKYIENTLAKFHELDLPVDAFIYDFEWYTPTPDYSLAAQGLPDFKDFSFNTNLFPDPTAQIADYKAQGVHFVGIRKPRMGNSDTLAMMREKNWGLSRLNGRENFESRDVDFANPDFREWYISQMAPLLAAGVDGWWNDEGEAAYTMYYYWNLTEKEALARYRPGARLWTLNRAFSPGLQRLGAAAWTGDIRSSWATLAATPTTLLNWSLAGLPYETCDIGGFIGNPSPELLSRWMEAGVFFPVMRSHSEISETPRFPWLFGPDALNAIRSALDLRYRLIPYYYSLAYETFETGVPIMRPLVMEYPNDPNAANLSDEWLVGSSLLAAPILQPGGKRIVYLPAGKWYPFESNVPADGGQTADVTAGLSDIPIYIRAGTILPLGPVIEHTSQMPGGPLELEIYPGKDATFTLAEDDGLTTNYLDGQTLRIAFKWNDATGQLTWTSMGNYTGKDIYQRLHVAVFDPAGKKQAESAMGTSGSLTPVQ
ncbi:MAG TPA: TIM-barrel domain-containing protein [Verrucomicrobiae bacterium]